VKSNANLKVDVEREVMTEQFEISKEAESQSEGTGIEIRTHKNLDRGTELTYAIVPIKDFDLTSPVFEHEVAVLLDEIYGENKVTYNIIFGDKRTREELNEAFKEELKKFIENPSNREIVLRLHELGADGKIIRDPEGQYYEHFLTLRKVGEKLIIAPAPVIHAITTGIGSGRLSATSFDDLTTILGTGFKGLDNNDYEKSGEGNAVIKIKRGHKSGSVLGAMAETGITKGDRFTLEIFPDSEMGHVAGFAGDPHSSILLNEKEVDYLIKASSPQAVSSVNIFLSETASNEEREQKMGFYKKAIQEKYHIPTRFFLNKDGGGERIFPGNGDKSAL